MTYRIHLRGFALMMVIACILVLPLSSIAGSASAINREVDAAIQNLYEKIPTAKDFSKTAKGILVFPNVVKAGFIIGAQYGEGALRKGGKTVAYYNTVAAKLRKMVAIII